MNFGSAALPRIPGPLRGLVPSRGIELHSLTDTKKKKKRIALNQHQNKIPIFFFFFSITSLWHSNSSASLFFLLLLLLVLPLVVVVVVQGLQALPKLLPDPPEELVAVGSGAALGGRAGGPGRAAIWLLPQWLSPTSGGGGGGGLAGSQDGSSEKKLEQNSFSKESSIG